jgi:FtsZ-binding cell division protein ZapB
LLRKKGDELKHKANKLNQAQQEADVLRDEMEQMKVNHAM